MDSKIIKTEKYFINFTNHPSEKWSEKQRIEAKKIGKIIDLPFPTVDATLTENDINKLANKVVEKILRLNPIAVLCQGEFTLFFSVAKKIKEQGISVLVACSERNVIETVDKDGNTRKSAIFSFVKFRKV